MIAIMSIMLSVTTLSPAWYVAFLTSALGLPAATGIAIMRYTLHDFDRLVNRTPVYGLLTALPGPGFASVVPLRIALSPLSAGGDLASAHGSVWLWDVGAKGQRQ